MSRSMAAFYRAITYLLFLATFLYAVGFAGVLAGATPAVLSASSSRSAV